MNANSLHRQQGVMLLEVLVGLLIFSVGILGMVGMQAASIQNSAAASYRTEASYLTNQIISMMWSDQANLANYALNTSDALCAQGLSGAATSANVNNWLANDVQKLPGTATVAGSGARQKIVIGANNLVTVTLCWKGPKDTSAHNFVATAQIN